MFRLYARYRVLHELRALLELALQRVAPVNAGQLEECRRRLEGICQAGADPACNIDLEALRKSVRTLIRAQVHR
ncbi:MAG TPA: hypothetical protein VHW25_06085 [Steroidobacteraceae bacterium]|nr:hypothetical protein [Steroidobacteraceae bacterium]